MNNSFDSRTREQVRSWAPNGKGRVALLSLSERVVRKFERMFLIPRRKARFEKDAISFLPPNYIFRPSLLEGGVVVDVGCASDPELSKALMVSKGMKAFGVDPTRKHRDALQLLQETSSGQFTHLAFALTSTPGSVIFHEPLDSESASVLEEHVNAGSEGGSSYEVEAVDLPGLMDNLAGRTVSLLKIDLEGAEFELLAGIRTEHLAPIRQIFVEFHHHCTSFTFQDTKRLVHRLESFGWSSYTLDRHNYLFVNSRFMPRR